MSNQICLTFILSIFFYLNLNAQLPFSVQIDEYARGLNSPVEIVNAGDERLFVLERSGRIKIINGAMNVLDVPFLDITNQVHNTGGQSEQGLLGLAFHPDYVDNGYFYVHYTAPNDDGVISRFSVQTDNANLADVDSEFEIMRIPQPYNNHNGGCIRFGPDGYFYIGLGDGGSANDPQNRAQNRQTFLGKMLRIDVDNGDPYAIPPTNPFADTDETLDEIWALGLRNPWKFSFDKLNGDLWIADVGQGEWEEINLQEAASEGGENYGWRCFEGNHTFISNGCNDQNQYDAAFLEYNHQGLTHCSITGGHVYRGEAADLQNENVYFYADYCSGTIWCAIEKDDVYEQVEIERLFGAPISTFGEGNDGELYFANISNGRIYHLNFDCFLDPNLSITAESCANASDGCVEINIEGGSGDYEYMLQTVFGENIDVDDFCNLNAGNYQLTITDITNDCTITESFEIERENIEFEFTLADDIFSAPAGYDSYQWFFNGEAIDGATSVNYTPTENGVYFVQILTEDGCNFTSSNTINFMSTNTRQIEGLNALSLSPNPTRKDVFIDVISEIKLILNASIQDVNGTIIREKKVIVNANEKIHFNLNDLPMGVYYFVLYDNKNSTVSHKFIKQ